MSIQLLSDMIQLERRYSRSVNLERDLKNPDSVKGYIITPCAQDLIERFIHSFPVGSTRAWTITGVYGTGKSSIAHFLTALCSPKDSLIYENALQVLAETTQEALLIQTQLVNQISDSGLIPAVVTARREPIHHTIMRGLYEGLVHYFDGKRGKKSSVFEELQDYIDLIESGKDFDGKVIKSFIAKITQSTKMGILLIIDELGKNFEYAAQHANHGDLYLLQELTEYPSAPAHQGLFVFGLLHQAFSEYARNMTGLQTNEWSKIQGRFEDVPFSESQEQMFRLMGKSIRLNADYKPDILTWAAQWSEEINNAFGQIAGISKELISEVYPLHPLAALALPQLCQRYAQNERSIFTFLASAEPHALQPFLQAIAWDASSPPTLQLHQVYDYFVESANMTASNRVQAQRWNEIHNRIMDARQLSTEEQQVLKTVGLLNLVSLGGTIKARMDMTIAALNHQPVGQQSKLYKSWKKVIQALIEKGFLTYRKKLDELRLWQGTDFDIEEALQTSQEYLSLNVEDVLNTHFELQPLVAQRHSYQTGTLRYFQRAFIGEKTREQDLLFPQSKADGFLYYVLEKTATLPEKTSDGRPNLYLVAENTEHLKSLGLDYAAFYEISQKAPELRTDVVARQEVLQRLAIAQRQAKETLHQIYSSGEGLVQLLYLNKESTLKGDSHLSRVLSEVCDETYPKSLVLWNELLNREELTAQGSKARKELVSAMLEHTGEENLGIEGYGPERSMFESLLKQTGLYRQLDTGYGFTDPNIGSGIEPVWQAVKDYCFSAISEPQSVQGLFEQLKRPPYGVKESALPVLLTAILMQFSDEISLFQDGVFIPLLHMSHFELLFRHPQRFSVKSFAIEGLRADFFALLEEMLATEKTKDFLQRTGSRNRTLLSLVKPLIGFVQKLPTFTCKTNDLSEQSRALRTALLETKDPEILIFEALPSSLGFHTIKSDDEAQDFKALQKVLIHSLTELNMAYPKLLNQCQQYLQSAFGVKDKDPLRKELTRRASFLKDKTVERKVTSFVNAILDNEKNEKSWLEAVAMVVADKPATEWRDQDIDAFETQLAEIYRRFTNLEAIQHELKNLPVNGKKAKRVVVADSSGNEFNQVVWIDKEDEEKITLLVEQLLRSPELKDNHRLQTALVAGLSEHIFQS
ncbi:hypothetical protein COW36_06920 [bacterium (Candidatus Blackallbacteria) CG17_big_fil_post_rev_8_21_14_2_50_48_46]|uniref:ATP-binding protein n=1 Tax=bacterium (Candidatus Blackallbacteria) CG17_big_fil_post_rev_8_21_14_2_50_48_46 TaxID=2014261 RepID=A0A2M7G7E1_9BACT|nr:MAG: hypothetical protein COW64_05360 [bacterium (Candidatus Blackallbacteria) CG18_big_fil_WC_8_21_14_2_50_49_26]PIW17928.1 MAG: hypothetical protein COW36_06920 [bacterium (Candidatus Blackallbacteria) CG17_big_fil_post_rev_8_21_14_2_50_48_46]PIW45747.1 MAG: hypothetical protein COW20_19100 [bacterium (Candidatus Blackallbacteria) CG13_big_fil_rev_8_21_14_2_50_49_14]